MRSFAHEKSLFLTKALLSECTSLPKIDNSNIKDILQKCNAVTVLGGELFDAAESGLTAEQTEELFRGKTNVSMCIRIVGTNYTTVDLGSILTIKTLGCKINKGGSTLVLPYSSTF